MRKECGRGNRRVGELYFCLVTDRRGDMADTAVLSNEKASQ
jgi:hypothetical protein